LHILLVLNRDSAKPAAKSWRQQEDSPAMVLLFTDKEGGDGVNEV